MGDRLKVSVFLGGGGVGDGDGEFVVGVNRGLGSRTFEMIMLELLLFVSGGLIFIGDL